MTAKKSGWKAVSRVQLNRILKEFRWLWATQDHWHVRGEDIIVCQTGQDFLKMAAKTHPRREYWLKLKNPQKHEKVKKVHRSWASDISLAQCFLSTAELAGIGYEIEYIFYRDEGKDLSGKSLNVSSVIRPNKGTTMHEMCLRAVGRKE